MSEPKTITRGLDKIKTQQNTTQIRGALKRALYGFDFKGGDSDYRGFHFDGKNEKGTEFSVEQMKGSEETVIEAEYELDLWVSGTEATDVAQTFATIVAILTKT